jgi:hypothetical protein
VPGEWVRLPDGTVMHLHYDRAPRRRCCVVGCDAWGELLCDRPVGRGTRTCSRSLCPAHATRTAECLDLCPQHTPEAAQRTALTARAAALVARLEAAEGQLRAGDVLARLRRVADRVGNITARRS